MCRRLPHRAFTLIEMTAVLALMAVLAGTAVVLLAGPRKRAAASDAVAAVAFADQQVRQAALASDRPQTLVVDLAAGRLSRDTTALAELTGGVRVVRVILGGEMIDFGQARIDVSAAGRSRSYAIGLSTPAGPRWIVVAGLTGQASEAPDAAAADAILGIARDGE